MENFENFYKNLSHFMSEFNHKNSYAKEKILLILYHASSHLSAADIKDEFLKRHKQNISMPSIYALLNFLSECNLTNVYDDNGVRKFELNLTAHHDHLICERCGKVKSFRDDFIEDAQDKICKDKNFTCISHSMILYGICDECLKNNFS
ncbi:transcriptional repressor [Campylobacter sp. RM9344]|uniref:Ferric uptake regulation protein n=1 Tax=Campylobacter californiensis TaxID=1032243 RepID=A0AAW3ZUB6_9BACT|nr:MULTISPECIES: transcriptional repressor [unclassified Campylobacter]MBE2985054.1 transcriptional repressor [Campylobacter sp. RM6883]MBE2986611.1 transcriptional repressor [Campylobacter sp. RM12919]MBE2987594.1 transcriptional repressor [Campylobacter sp. RM12920]MBE2995621.1 transcriptional repressor [Campylobacter sp. RM6913]MBE3022254.1 transcriptional repressor [Campylobacter sp. 7477a]MBE3029217.1 transcriptional repressor [Campylobacter sp. RM9344]